MADSAKSLHDRELRDTISDLKTVIKNLNDTIHSLNQRIEELSRKLDASSAQIDKITEERDNLKAQVQYLSKKLFGTSSEKGKCHDIEGQINLFNEAEAEQNPAVLEDELQEITEETVTKKRKSRKTNAERFKDLPTEKSLSRSVRRRSCMSAVRNSPGKNRGRIRAAGVRHHTAQSNCQRILQQQLRMPVLQGAC